MCAKSFPKQYLEGHTNNFDHVLDFNKVQPDAYMGYLVRKSDPFIFAAHL